MERTIIACWVRIHNWLEVNAPELVACFRPPGQNAKRVERATRSLEFELPEAYRTWINDCADGQRMDGPALGRGIIPVPDSKRGEAFSLGDISLMSGTWETFCGDYAKKERPVIASNGVKPVFFDPNWFTFAVDQSNDDGNCLAFDLASDTPGSIGQIIFWSLRKPKRYVLCNSFEELFQQIDAELSSGKLHFDGRNIVSSDLSLFCKGPTSQTAVAGTPRAVYGIMIEFAGDVTVIHDDDDHEICDPNVLKVFDGESSIDSMIDFVEGHLENEIVQAILPGEGAIELSLDEDKQRLSCRTRFGLRRVLTESEQDSLQSFVIGQWLDGIGEGFAPHGSKGYTFHFGMNLHEGNLRVTSRTLQSGL